MTPTHPAQPADAQAEGAKLPSISGRITWRLFVISALGAVLTTAAVAAVLVHEVDEMLDHGLRETADLIHNVLVRAPHTSVPVPLDDSHDEYEEQLVWQVLHAQQGHVVTRSHKAPQTPLMASPQPGLGDSTDGNWRVLALPLRSAPGHMLLVAQSELERQEARSEALVFALVAALSTSLVVTVALGLLIRRELQPLGRLSREVAAYDPLKPGTSLGIPDRQELAPIVHAATELGQRLAKRVISERAFTAHAAHALRTPLAGIDVQLALVLQEAPAELRDRLQATRGAVSRLSRVMHALLAMFRSGIEPKMLVVAVSELVEAAGMVGLQVNVLGAQHVDADPDLMAAVLMNLLDNAKRHGASTVTIEAWRDAQHQELRISDDGLGCDPSQRAALQDALDRQDYQGGSGLRGLGLILADLVLRAHQGRVALMPPEAGKGFHLVLSWPRRTAVAA